MEAGLVWGLGLLALALMLVAIDIFIPTFGVLPLMAAVTAVAGVILLWTHSASWGIVGTALVMIGGPAAFFLGLRIMPNTPLGRRLVLGSPNPDEDDENGPGHPGVVADTLKDLIGVEAVVVSDLRPVGTIRLGDERMDALAESSVLKAGTRVKVVGLVDGRLLKVRAIA